MVLRGLSALTHGGLTYLVINKKITETLDEQRALTVTKKITKRLNLEDFK